MHSKPNIGRDMASVRKDPDPIGKPLVAGEKLLAGHIVALGKDQRVYRCRFYKSKFVRYFQKWRGRPVNPIGMAANNAERGGPVFIVGDGKVVRLMNEILDS